MSTVLVDFGRWAPSSPMEQFFWAQRLTRLGLLNWWGPEVREPGLRYPDASVWHRDCGNEAQWVIVWANSEPTQLQLYYHHRDHRLPRRRKRLLRLNPYHIYAFDNLSFLHRTPPIISRDRVFCRARLASLFSSSSFGKSYVMDFFLPAADVREMIAASFARNEQLLATFVKKGDGSVRHMTIAPVPAEQVRSPRHGLDADASAGNLFVWDVEKERPCSIPATQIVSLGRCVPVP